MKIFLKYSAYKLLYPKEFMHGRCVFQVVKMNEKQDVIDLSKEYSIVTQFTSFVAIEKRDKVGEVFTIQQKINGVFGTQRRPYLVIDHDDFTLCFY
jgi:hypothetical protein